MAESDHHQKIEGAGVLHDQKRECSQELFVKYEQNDSFTPSQHAMIVQNFLKRKVSPGKEMSTKEETKKSCCVFEDQGSCGFTKSTACIKRTVPQETKSTNRGVDSHEQGYSLPGDAQILTNLSSKPASVHLGFQVHQSPAQRPNIFSRNQDLQNFQIPNFSGNYQSGNLCDISWIKVKSLNNRNETESFPNCQIKSESTLNKAYDIESSGHAYKMESSSSAYKMESSSSAYKMESSSNHTNNKQSSSEAVTGIYPPFCKQGIFQFIPRETVDGDISIADQYIMIEKRHCEKLSCISLPEKVAYVYNPLEYAFNTHYDFINKYCNSEKEVLFLGMNPGPWGMSQNGVPFGESNIVREWLQISGQIFKPVHEHPKRLVHGLACARSEVSGKRFWGFFRHICGTPENFFRTAFVYNMCPLAFMATSGKNITPPQLTSSVLQQINTACDKALLDVLQLLKVKVIVGVGKFAYDRARKVLMSSEKLNIRMEIIMHPSPINPAANKGWDNIVHGQLSNMRILSLLQGIKNDR